MSEYKMSGQVFCRKWQVRSAENIAWKSWQHLLFVLNTPTWFAGKDSTLANETVIPENAGIRSYNESLSFPKTRHQSECVCVCPRLH